jgi:D-tyrosyl-tRNA(Tyr) deacylase
MRALVQRVRAAQVTVEGRVVGAIDHGLLVFVCAMDDQAIDTEAWARRLCGLRVFADERGRMSLNVSDVDGSLLLVSQFTLSADMNKGLRPSFGRATSPTLAQQQIEALGAACSAHQVPVAYGQFGADMQVTLTNDGPVTIFIDKP